MITKMSRETVAVLKPLSDAAQEHPTIHGADWRGLVARIYYTSMYCSSPVIIHSGIMYCSQRHGVHLIVYAHAMVYMPHSLVSLVYMATCWFTVDPSRHVCNMGGQGENRRPTTSRKSCQILLFEVSCPHRSVQIKKSRQVSHGTSETCTHPRKMEHQPNQSKVSRTCV